MGLLWAEVIKLQTDVGKLQGAACTEEDCHPELPPGYIFPLRTREDLESLEGELEESQTTRSLVRQ